MHLWVIFIILYGIFKGLREPIKKNALTKNGVLETLFLYTFFGFLMCIPFSPDAFSIKPEYLFYVFIKSAVIFIAWIAAFWAVKKLPVSFYGIVDMSRVVFSTLLGVAVLKESLTVKGVTGLILVIIGIYMLNAGKKSSGEKIKTKYVLMTFLSCALNAVSGTMDKVLMSTGEITSSQLQFWFMLMLSALYFVYIYAKGERINYKTGFKNPGIYIISALLIFGDRLLFIANADPQSKVTLMTIIKQSSVIVTILSGWLIYKEKNILYKFVCAAVTISGILIAAL